MSNNKKFIYDNLVVGASIEAVMFAFYNKLKIIYARSLEPLAVEKIEDFGLGSSKKEIWNKHMYQLSIAGYNPFFDTINHIRYEDKNNLSISSKEDNIYTISFNNLFVFDDYNFLELPNYKNSKSTLCKVVDFFTYSSKRLKLENIQTKNNFLNQIIFDDKKKIITVISFIKKQDLDKYPEYLSKIKTEALIGKIEINHNIREVIDLQQNVYDDFENVCFVYSDIKLMFDFHRRNDKIDYMKFFRLKMGM